MVGIMCKEDKIIQASEWFCWHQAAAGPALAHWGMLTGHSLHHWIRTLQWRHNERAGVWNHRHLDGFLNHLVRRRSKKSPKLRLTGLCEGNSPVNSPHKRPVTRKMFPFDDVIMRITNVLTRCCLFSLLLCKCTTMGQNWIGNEPDASSRTWCCYWQMSCCEW